MKTKTDPIINVMDYESLSLFLKEFYQAKKGMDSTFSFERWNRGLGGKNRSYLQLLINGKRKVNDEYRKLFLNYFQFNSHQREYFLELSQMELSRSEVSREQLKKSVGNRQKIDKARVVKAQEAYLSNLKIPVLFTLTTFTDFSATLENLAEKLGESTSQTAEWLKIIEDANLVAFDRISQTWKAKDNLIIIPKDDSGTLLKFQRMSLQAALDCLDMGELNAQPISYQLCLREDQVEEFNLRAKALVDQLAIEAVTDELGDRKLYQWTWAIFPLLK